MRESEIKKEMMNIMEFYGKGRAAGKIFHRFIEPVESANAELQKQVVHPAGCIDCGKTVTIDSLKEQLTAEQEKNRWIPVGGRLPEKPKKTEQIECIDKHERAWVISLFPSLFHKVDLVKDGVTHWRYVHIPEGK